MCADVFLKVSRGFERLGTLLLGTLVRLLPRVSAQVRLQGVARGETLLTRMTDVGALACVVPLVGLQCDEYSATF